jgi:hypothetical protein
MERGRQITQPRRTIKMNSDEKEIIGRYIGQVQEYKGKPVFIWNDIGIVKAEVSKKSAPIKIGSFIRMYKNGKVHSWKPKRTVIQGEPLK